jgi:predicted amidohydrolase YtcJ
LRGGRGLGHPPPVTAHRLRLASCLAAGIAIHLLVGCRLPERPAADLIVRHAQVWTGNPDQPLAESVAILGDRIVAVGTDRDVDRWRGRDRGGAGKPYGGTTRVIDAGGRLVVPGFNDAHVHFVSGGVSLENVKLKDAHSAGEFVQRIVDYAKTLPPGAWVTGGDWDEHQWKQATLPDATLVDAGLAKAGQADRAVYVDRYDGHMALANSVAMRLAGLTARTREVAGGEIVHDAHGNPNGLLKDAAMGIVSKVEPPMTRERRLRAITVALEHAASLGVTSVQDMNPDAEEMAIYAELAEKNALTTRIYAAPPLARWKEFAGAGARRAFGSPWYRIGALKGYADGSLGARTAYFFEPFSDAPTRGLLSDEMHPVDAMRQRMMGADAAGLQLCIHAIGDAGISAILDLFDEVARAHGPADRRFRIEHAQHMGAKDFDRFVALGVVASMQPYHAIDEASWAEGRIGPDRIKRTYAFRTFLDQGVHLAFGTDWDVAPLNPMLGLYAAVTRAGLDGKTPGGWVPEQKITILEAITAYTRGSAYAEFQDDVKGTLAPGKLADLVILSDDIFRIPPEKIRDVKVVTTIAGGRVVWPR